MMRPVCCLLLCTLLSACNSDPSTGTGGADSTTTTETIQCDPPSPGSKVPFVDVTDEWNLTFEHHATTEFCDITDTVGGPGVCAFDADGDGDVDLYFLDREGFPNKLYRNDGQTFTDVTEGSGAGLTDDSHACLAFDYDGDGDLDLFVGNSGPDKLLKNTGGVFEDVTEELGLIETGYTTTATAADIDVDGDLDLFVGHLVTPETCPAGFCSPTPKACEAETNMLWVNTGGMFINESDARGITHQEPTLASLFFDFDSDGDVDLFVGNDIGSKNPDRLYKNDGTGHFKDAAQGLGLELYGTDTMGIDVGDADGDGKVDIVMTDFELQPTRLITCKDPVLPCDMVGINQESTQTVKWGIALADFDHDTDLDIFHTGGHVNVPVDHAGDLHQLHWNDEEGFFTYHVPSEGEALAERHLGRGAAFADLDGDLDLDIVIANADRPAQILLNQAAGGHALLVQLDSLSAGARVTVQSGGTSRTEHALVGGSYAGSSDPRVHFGLGNTCAVDVLVQWPGGAEKQIKGVSTGQSLLVVRD
ncbi:MAG: CRTAC1 family protein [Polyangiaceae bacterium]|nr:CRTAC1 family protein [Polyangiaceae bacterium]